MSDAFGWGVCGHPFRFFFLVEALASHSVRAALQRQQTIFHIRGKLRENALVVPSQVKLCVTFVRPENLVGIREFNGKFLVFVPARPQFLHADLSGKRTAWRRLSSRRPRKTGWRSLPSAVHSWKEICATSRGARK